MKQKYNLVAGFEACENASCLSFLKNLLIAAVLLFGVAGSFGQGSDCANDAALHITVD